MGNKLNDIPEDRYICKYCWYCFCNEDSTGKAMCHEDIGELVDVNGDACCQFDYDDEFNRT